MALVILILLTLYILAPKSVLASPAAPFPFDETQPDGSVISLRMSGDAHYHVLEDVDGYTVVRADKWFVYAKQGENGQLHSTP
jgi:hypothetical protein